jgi:hypothetical protein
MAQFVEVLDELQISRSSAEIEQPRQSNPTIISKFRNNFLPNTRQSISRSKTPSTSTVSKPVFFLPSQESTTGNQILLSTDEPTTPKIPSSLTTTKSLPLTRPRSAIFVQDDAHV